MDTIQYEAVKVALKQDKTGFMLTLNVHPDQIPSDLVRDFVGARYQVVMVRLDGNDQPMDRKENSRDPVKLAVMLCKDPEFAKFLYETSQSLEEQMTENDVADWLKLELNIVSRSDLKSNAEATRHLYTINQEFKAWKQK